MEVLQNHFAGNLQCANKYCFKTSHPQPSYFNFSFRKAFFPKVDAASQLADNSKDDMQQEAAAADDVGDDGKRKKKKEKIGFRDRKVNMADIFQFFLTYPNKYLYLLGVNYYYFILLTLRLLMSYIYIYIYGAPILDVSRSHTMMQHSR